MYMTLFHKPETSVRPLDMKTVDVCPANHRLYPQPTMMNTWKWIWRKGELCSSSLRFVEISSHVEVNYYIHRKHSHCNPFFDGCSHSQIRRSDVGRAFSDPKSTYFETTLFLRIYLANYPQIFVFCYVLLWFGSGQICPYTSGLLHWHHGNNWDNLTIINEVTLANISIFISRERETIHQIKTKQTHAALIGYFHVKPQSYNDPNFVVTGRQRRLSSWQPPLPPVMTKLASWQLSDFCEALLLVSLDIIHTDPTEVPGGVVCPARVVMPYMERLHLTQGLTGAQQVMVHTATCQRLEL